MPKKSRLNIGCLLATAVFSTFVAIAAFPSGLGRMGIAFAFIAFVSLFLRVGWFVPCSIMGTYIGIQMDVRVKGGSIESQMQETVTSIAAGAIIGFTIGAFIDLTSQSARSASAKNPEPHQNRDLN